MEFYDYKTAPVNGSDVVDLNHTGMSFYDDFLTGDSKTLKYLKDYKNLIGEVHMMSPEEYFKQCSLYGFLNQHPSVDRLKQERSYDTKTLEHLKSVLTVYKKKFPMPMLNKAENGQEGLHRMYVIGEMFGWDHKVPVLVVDWADKQRAYEEVEAKRTRRISYNIKKAVQDALKYNFSDTEALKEQIQWELDKQFDYNDDGISTPVQFEFISDDQEKTFSVLIGSAGYTFDYDDVNFSEDLLDDDDQDTELDLTDLDLDDNEDFLVRYFGDNWKETHPHLKHTFHIDENLTTKTVRRHNLK